MSTSEKTALLPPQQSPNYVPDRMGYAAGAFGSLGGGIYQGVRILLGASAGGWGTMGALATTFAVSIFGLVRTHQHARIKEPTPLQNVRVDVSEETHLTPVIKEIEQIFNTLKLQENSNVSIQNETVESSEQHLLRQIQAVDLCYRQKVEELRKSVNDKTTEVTQLKTSQGSKQRSDQMLQTQNTRLTQDLAETKKDLAQALSDIQDLKEEIDRKGAAFAFQEKQIEQLDTLVRQFSNLGTNSPNSEQLLQLGSLVSNLKSGSRNSSTVSSPSKSSYNSPMRELNRSVNNDTQPL